MLTIKKALELNSLDEINNEISERYELLSKMVGTLYPEIIMYEINQLNMKILEIKNNDALKELQKELEKEENEKYSHNQSILEEIERITGSDSVKEDFIKLLDFSDVINKIEIVEKPKGDNQNEKCGIFTSIYVDQWSVGISGDSFQGNIYGKFAKNKWLKIPYAC